MVLEVTTPDRKVFEGEADSVQLPGIDGLFQVLNHHAPMVSALGQGPLTIVSGSRTENFNMMGGVVEILNNKVIVLADFVE